MNTMTRGHVRFSVVIEDGGFEKLNTDWDVMAVSESRLARKSDRGIFVAIDEKDENLILNWDSLAVADLPELEYYFENRLTLPNEITVMEIEEVKFRNTNTIEFSYDGPVEDIDEVYSSFELGEAKVLVTDSDKSGEYSLSSVSTPIDSLEDVQDAHRQLANKLANEVEFTQVL